MTPAGAITILSESAVTKTVELEIRCPLDTEVLSVIRTFITSLACQMGFSEDQAGEIEMAVDEACANVIRHAYKHLGISPDLEEGGKMSGEGLPDDCVLLLRVSLNSTCLRVQVIDNGIGMNRKPGGVCSIEEFTSKGGAGGLGTYIIKNFMDEVDYDYPPNKGTILTMTKYLRTANS